MSEAEESPIEVHSDYEVEGEPLASTRRLARGMRAARRLELTLERVRAAVLHAKQASSSPSRRRCLKQLRKLGESLEDLQRTAISHGLGRRAWASLEAHLEPIDHRLDHLLSKKPTEPRLEKTRLVLRTHRRALQG